MFELMLFAMIGFPLVCAMLETPRFKMELAEIERVYNGGWTGSIYGKPAKLRKRDLLKRWSEEEIDSVRRVWFSRRDIVKKQKKEKIASLVVALHERDARRAEKSEARKAVRRMKLATPQQLAA